MASLFDGSGNREWVRAMAFGVGGAECELENALGGIGLKVKETFSISSCMLVIINIY